MNALGLTAPVIQAPMGGGPSTVALAAAVSEAGGLGSLAGGYLPGAQIRDQITQLRRVTGRPFAVNLFIPGDVRDDPAGVKATWDLLGPFRRRFGIADQAVPDRWQEDFDEQLEVVLRERVPLLSVTFGSLPGHVVEECHRAGTLVMGTATNVAEAVELERNGVDFICVQGAEAGGHHGTWLADPVGSAIGTMALVPLVCSAVRAPVVAAGGIMDERGVAAALCLGAQAAQMGTAFMLCPEAGTVPAHRVAMRASAETSILLTCEVTGRLARGVRNELMDELRGHTVPPYPVMNALTRALRSASASAGDPRFMSLWCGQAAPLATERSAAEIVRAICDGAERIACGIFAAQARPGPD